MSTPSEQDNQPNTQGGNEVQDLGVFVQTLVTQMVRHIVVILQIYNDYYSKHNSKRCRSKSYKEVSYSKTWRTKP
jgi:hypothetical protein